MTPSDVTAPARTQVARLDASVVTIEDAATWNSLLQRLSGNDVRQGYEWGEVRRTEGWRPYRVAVLADAKPLVMIAAIAKPIPGLRRTIVYAPRGPVMDVENGSAWPALRLAVQAIEEATRPAFVRISPDVPDGRPDITARFAECGFRHLSDYWTIWNTPRIVMNLDMTSDLDAVWRGLRKRYREYITSGPRRGLTVRPATSLDDVRRFHTDLAARGRVKGFPVRAFEYFATLWTTYARRGDGVLLLAEHAGALAGGLLGARLGTRASMLYAESLIDPQGSKAHHGPSLYWEFIRWAKGEGCTSVDWGGSGTHFPARESDPGFGVYRFKMGFGGTLDCTQGYYDRVVSPALHAAFRLVEKRVLPIAWRLRAKLNR